MKLLSMLGCLGITTAGVTQISNILNFTSENDAVIDMDKLNLKDPIDCDISELYNQSQSFNSFKLFDFLLIDVASNVRNQGHWDYSQKLLSIEGDYKSNTTNWKIDFGDVNEYPKPLQTETISVSAICNDSSKFVGTLKINANLINTPQPKPGFEKFQDIFGKQARLKKLITRDLLFKNGVDGDDVVINLIWEQYKDSFKENNINKNEIIFENFNSDLIFINYIGPINFIFKEATISADFDIQSDFDNFSISLDEVESSKSSSIVKCFYLSPFIDNILSLFIDEKIQLKYNFSATLNNGGQISTIKGSSNSEKFEQTGSGKYTINSNKNIDKQILNNNFLSLNWISGVSDININSNISFIGSELKFTIRSTLNNSNSKKNDLEIKNFKITNFIIDKL